MYKDDKKSFGDHKHSGRDDKSYKRSQHSDRHALSRSRSNGRYEEGRPWKKGDDSQSLGIYDNARRPLDNEHHNFSGRRQQGGGRWRKDDDNPRGLAKRREQRDERWQKDDKRRSRGGAYSGRQRFVDGDADDFLDNRPAVSATKQSHPKEDDGCMRLNKYIAHAGICSRREADELIAAGAVTVNGEVVTQMGYQVQPGDTVGYGGETLHSEAKRYFLLNKPKGFITTLDDPQERKTVMMLIDGACPERIYPVGRLDRATTGLLLFTNDGDLAKKLTHPSSNVYKIYHVEVNKAVSTNDMRQMLDGVELEDGFIKVDDVQYADPSGDKRVVGVELHSGKNRIVRRIFEHFGYEIHKLDRVVFAGLTKKDLPRGRYRELSPKEVGFLKMI